MSLATKFRKLLKNDVLRHAGMLIGGTTAAQLLLLLALPLLTRVYSPEQFSSLAAFTALIAICSVSASLRFDIAIPLPAENEDAFHLLSLALASSIIVTCLVSIIIYWGMTEIPSGIALRKLIPQFWPIPIGILLTALYTSLQSWLVRRKQFRTIAVSRIWQATSSSAAQLLLGWLGAGTLGLLIGQLLNSGSGIFQLLRAIRKDIKEYIHRLSYNKLLMLIKEYKNFPSYSSLDALINAMGAHAPVIFIAALALGGEAGFLMLALRLVQTPVNIIGGALSQVYLSRAPTAYREGHLPQETLTTIASILKVAAGPVAFIGIVAPLVVEPVLGYGWQRVGDLVLWMVPWMIFQLAASPISMVMHVRSKQRTMLLLTLVGLIFRMMAIAAAFHYHSTHIAEWYATSSAIYYFLCLILFMRAAGISIQNFSKQLWIPLLFIGIWIILAVVVRIAWMIGTQG